MMKAHGDDCDKESDESGSDFDSEKGSNSDSEKDRYCKNKITSEKTIIVSTNTLLSLIT